MSQIQSNLLHDQCIMVILLFQQSGKIASVAEKRIYVSNFLKLDEDTRNSLLPLTSAHWRNWGLMGLWGRIYGSSESVSDSRDIHCDAKNK
jgi:hypothetical protein